MTNAETEKSEKTPAAFNGWSWAMGGALVAGLVIGSVMWMVGRKNDDAYAAQIAARDLKIQQVTRMIAETAQLSGTQTESLKKLEPYRGVIAAMESKQVDLIELGVSSEVPEGRGRIVHDVVAGKYFLVAKGLAAVDEQHEYAIWLTDDRGRELAGTFTPNAEAVAVAAAVPPRKMAATTFEVTLEKRGEAESHAGKTFLIGKAAK